jgi:hypothetical protein
MEALSNTEPHFIAFDTSIVQSSKYKNEKVISLINAKKQFKKDSSEMSGWLGVEDKPINKYYYEKWLNFLTSEIHDYHELLESAIREIVEAYKNVNILGKLNINSWYVREYSPSTLNVLHSLVDIGSIIFEDSRSKTELESKWVNDFFSNKAKVIATKHL